MQELIFATQNHNKTNEIASLLGNQFVLKNLSDSLVTEEIPETGSTLKENALQKARYVFERTGKNCFADDTGLEVEALNGEPGVYSARYAGPQKNSEDNIAKLLTELSNTANRNARFVTCIALILNGKEYLFEGEVKGQITTVLKGNNGFGYDPVFIPENENRTFAEMELTEKNAISHRARAFSKLVAFLKA